MLAPAWLWGGIYFAKGVGKRAKTTVAQAPVSSARSALDGDALGIGDALVGEPGFISSYPLNSSRGVKRRAAGRHGAGAAQARRCRRWHSAGRHNRCAVAQGAGLADT